MNGDESRGDCEGKEKEGEGLTKYVGNRAGGEGRKVKRHGGKFYVRGNVPTCTSWGYSV